MSRAAFGGYENGTVALGLRIIRSKNRARRSRSTQVQQDQFIRPIDTVIFDLDGVLILGSNQGYLDCHHYALQSVGIHLSREEEKRRLLEFWSYPHEFQLGLLIGNDKQRLKSACKKYEDYLFSDRFFDNVTLVPGAKELLERLSLGHYKMAIATGMHNRQIDIVFGRFGIRKSLFKAIISAYEINNDEFQKPHPYMLRQIMDRLLTDTFRTIYVGDSRDDIVMAKRASVPFVAVLTGNLTRQEAESEGAHLIIDSVAELDCVLELIGLGGGNKGCDKGNS